MMKKYLPLESRKDGRFLVLQKNEWNYKIDSNGCRIIAKDEMGDDRYEMELVKSKVIKYDLSEKQFKRELKSGELRNVADTGVATFFRNMDKENISESFTEDLIYRNLLRMVWEQNRYRFRKNCNFARIFDLVESYLANESYLAAGIKLSSDAKFSVPLKHFSKPIQRFMKESQFTIGKKWEMRTKNENEAKILNDLCQHVLTNYHDDLEIYRHVENLVNSWGRSWQHFCQICKKMNQEDRNPVAAGSEESQERRGYGWEDKIGYHGDHKHLFDYLVRVCRTEAMEVSDALSEYHDYLSMSRRIERVKKFNRLREAGEDVRISDVGFPNFNRIEKYPKNLTILHRIVTRNWNVMSECYDELLFANQANKNYEWADFDFCMLIPSTSQDVKDEGTNNNHCVGSYVNSILEGRTQIAFMRSCNELDESLLTIEIRSGGIQQVRGYGNRLPTASENEWLLKYAKAKNIDFQQAGFEAEDGSKFNDSKGRWNEEWNMPTSSAKVAKDKAVRLGIEMSKRV
jgi:hypothetical protein